MSTNRLGALALGSSILALSMGVACSDDSSDGVGNAGGAGGKAGSSRGGSTSAGSAGKGGSPQAQAGSAGTGGKPEQTAGGGGDEAGGQGGALGGAAGAGGEPSQGGDETGGQGGGGGEGGEAQASCASVRTSLLGPIDAIATGLVTVTSAQDAGTVTVVVDASAGGYMAAANNPYIYVSLADKARVGVTDLQADASSAWDLALKRDNIRSNGGDGGPGSAQVAELPAANFDTVTAAAATTADFGQDTFVDANSCAPIADETGKPITSFDGWYVYAPASMSLTPADKVYLVRGANGTSLYKLQIKDYYAEVDNGQGGTVKKSAVFTLTYQAL